MAAPASPAVTRIWSHRCFAALALALFAPACGAPGNGVAPRPNVVLLVLDTTRADRCSVNGYSRPTTPALEAIARRGVLYRNTWSCSCWTAPSHASLFTGLRPEHHGLLCGVRPFLDPGATTLAEIFAAEGYRTGGFSCNIVVSDEFGLGQGFQTFRLPDPGIREGVPSSRWSHGQALDWVSSAISAGQPFFLFVNDMEPHLPYRPPEPFFSRFVPLNADAEIVEACRRLVGGRPSVEQALGRIRFTEQHFRILSDLYDGEIATLDALIGTLVSRLDEMGAMENTVLVILGDHGENLGDHGLVEHMFSLHRSVLRVPLMIVAPGRLPAGEVEDRLVRLEDVFPTILELCGIDPPSEIDAESLLDRLDGRIARAVQGHFFSAGLFPDRPEVHDAPVFLPLRSVFDGRWHLIVREDGFTELYDVTADPEETKNLAEEQPDRVARLEG